MQRYEILFGNTKKNRFFLYLCNVIINDCRGNCSKKKRTYMRQKINFLIIVLACLVSLPVKAKDDVQLMRLQAEMLRLISTNDKEQFTKVTEDLKNLCNQHGNERLFYTAWVTTTRPMSRWQSSRRSTTRSSWCLTVTWWPAVMCR